MHRRKDWMRRWKCNVSMTNGKERREGKVWRLKNEGHFHSDLGWISGSSPHKLMGLERRRVGDVGSCRCNVIRSHWSRRPHLGRGKSRQWVSDLHLCVPGGKKLATLKQWPKQESKCDRLVREETDSLLTLNVRCPLWLATRGHWPSWPEHSARDRK